ncbi:MAG: DUF2484 family protein [Ascidiaceihabitans sp.]|jgi:hypothetical protein|nr:DUF2484 family protein [Ascidiaceihabitans sp.]
MILLWACIVWVFTSAAFAMLPIRYQYVPAVILLIAAPILILLIGVQVSAWIAIAAIVGSISMFRNPLRYLWAKICGQNLQRPPEFSE